MSSELRQPWDPDVTLEPETVRAIVARVRPDLAPVEVELLGAGWDFWAYLVNEQWVFRFPKRKREQKRLAKEHALLDLIARHLDVPVPRYPGPPLEDDAFPYIFGAYEKLEGVQAYQVSPKAVDLGRLGSAFGHELRKLHAIPREDVAALWPDVTDESNRRFSTLCERARGYFHWLPHDDTQLRDHMESFFDVDRALPEPFEGAPVLAHTDPHAEHLLLEAGALHRLAGIIDWGDVSLDDPAPDVSAPYPWGGEPLLMATLSAYDSKDTGLETRARFIGAYVALVELDYASKLRRDPYVPTLLGVLRRVPIA